LPLIGALLGHATPTTTARYAHLFDDPQRAATERVGAIIEAAGKASGENVTPFKGGRRAGVSVRPRWRTWGTRSSGSTLPTSTRPISARSRSLTRARSRGSSTTIRKQKRKK